MEPRPAETCAECGFDSGAWRIGDAVTLLGALGEWWSGATSGLDPSVLNRRPADAVWSTLEYGLHSALVTAMNRVGVEMILAEDGCRLPRPPALPDAAGSAALLLDREAVVDDIGREGSAFAEAARRAALGAWRHSGDLAGDPLRADWLLFHAVHDATHHQLDVARGLASMGEGTPAGVGTVFQINTSDGGVPKLPVAAAQIGWRGLVGDQQADRKHHGRPFQALCLWSAEVIDELASQGHPIGPGKAGENVTVSGLVWDSLRPGSLLRLGTALAEVSFAATPCAKQRAWFSDGDFGRIDYDRNPGLARWYAWVRQPGAVRVGDAVVVQPRDAMVRPAAG
ncbi:MAG TPA: MOSC domain-containing protein [Acidimicrobiales bacterium]|nr:MOSC domain-containing protein [Acidimicrobiales bacterium]